MKVFAAIVFGGLLALAAGYGGGAPEGACGDMVPQHHTPAQTTVSPFAIDINKSTVKPKGKLYSESSY